MISRKRSSRMSLQEGSRLFQDITVLTHPNTYVIEGTTIPVMCFKPTNCQHQITLLYSHDYLESMVSIRDWLGLLSAVLKVRVICWEYPGFCEENPQYSTSSTQKDIKIVWKHLTETLKIPPEDIVIYGKGAGCGVSLYIAYKQKVSKKKSGAAGLILVEPLIDLAFAGKEFITEGKIKKIDTPSVVVVGNNVEKNSSIKKLFHSLSSQIGFFEVDGTKDFETSNTDELINCINHLMKKVFPTVAQFESNEVEKKIAKKPSGYVDPKEVLTNWLKPKKLDHLVTQVISMGYNTLDDIKLMPKTDVQFITENVEEQNEFWAVVCKLIETGNIEQILDTSAARRSTSVPKNWAPHLSSPTLQPHTQKHSRHLSMKFGKEDKGKSTPPIITKK
ncbi:hypothetical protein EIN_495520 [Entamoeba invadens IP1]|uniref:Serine aminopeptidase S33 domain-containing protein n=1 Tax=Entamoeba invadens IP1 TaxID=370355 RepID=A0A0A1TZP2_ENTIV|nr:hypothetical protein EIN_495520 [Entamoeba invadens IP1]ELP87097.1 hypothetical protein EIN_495520 [Entamoeba invadens IP1]|eukprot:XP_004253868.1 hypothetical protein EIN_495520 [Entamoeba invadens IP1]